MRAVLSSKENYRWLVPLLLGLAVIICFLLRQSFFPDAGDLLKKGRAAFGRKNFALARQNFNQAVKMSRLSSGARNEAAFFSAISYGREERFGEGKKALEQYVKDYPDSFWTPQAYFELADCEKNLGNNQRAWRIYQKIIKEFPLTTWAGYSQDRIEELKGKL